MVKNNNKKLEKTNYSYLDSKEHLKKDTYNKGITLIAVIITIIVMLILLGVSVTLALNGELFSTAEKAKTSYKDAETEEKVQLSIASALIDGLGLIKTDNFIKALNANIGEENYIIKEIRSNKMWRLECGNYKVVITERGEIVDTRNIWDLENTIETTPWLPDKFYQVETTNLETGLVITNGTDYYVWIEVPRTISATVLRNDVETTVMLKDTKDENEIETILKKYIGNYNTTDNKDIWFDSEGKTYETSSNETSSNPEDTKGCGMTYEQYVKTYSSMLKSIQEYGGFWISQYEAGIAYEKDGEKPTYRQKGDDLSVATYSKNNYVYNNLYCYQAQQIAHNDTTEEYICSLLFGIQWDLVCRFIDENTSLEFEDINTSSSSWGNFQGSLWTSNENSRYSEDGGNMYINDVCNKNTAKTILLTTGAIEKTTLNDDTSPMNIYDFAGNVWEYTLECASGTGKVVTIRGGNCINKQYAAASRYSGKSTAIGYNAGFRVTLY